MRLAHYAKRFLEIGWNALRSAPEYCRISFLMFLDKLAGKKIVIFDAEELQYVPFVSPVADILLKDERMSVYYATFGIYLGHPVFGKLGVPASRIFDAKLSRHMGLADLFLAAHVHTHGPRNACRVHMFHGHPVKYAAFPQEPFSRFWVHFALGPLARKWIEDTIVKYGLGDQNVRVFSVGYPKLDALAQGQFNGKEVLQSLGLNPEMPTVLYAPSWDEGLSLRAAGEKIVEALLNMPDVNVLVKLHPCSCVPSENPHFQFYTGGTEWLKVFEKFDGHSRYRFLTDAVINPILAASDVMVTDVSSVALEYMVLDRPIIYFDSPQFFEKTVATVYKNYGFENYTGDPRTDPMINAGRHTGVVIDTAEELTAAIARCLANPQELSIKRQELIRQLLYNPGLAGPAAAAVILELLGLSTQE